MSSVTAAFIYYRGVVGEFPFKPLSLLFWNLQWIKIQKVRGGHGMYVSWGPDHSREGPEAGQVLQTHNPLSLDAEVAWCSMTGMK